MFIKKIFCLITPGLTFFLSISCTHQEKINNSENAIKRIPVIVNDSTLFSIDRSPMDMSYFPPEYPKEKMANPGLKDPFIRVIYSRPKRNGRVIFADSSVTANYIQHYGQDWRLGANEATEIEFFRPAIIGNKKISPGRYILYCIPYPGKWKIVLNNNLFSWGLHMDKTKDIIETEIPVTSSNMDVEYFTITFQAAGDGCNMLMQWGEIKAILPVRFN